MPNCSSIDLLVTPYIDGELAAADRDTVADHLRVCPPCHARVAAERAVRHLIQERKGALSARCAPESLRAKCSEYARQRPPALPHALPPRRAFEAPSRVESAAGAARPAPRESWRTRLAPLALAASLVLIVAAAFLYQLTEQSSRVMAAELAADHVKCFAMNRVLGTNQGAAVVESAMASAFGWDLRLPAEAAARAGLELVGARPCMYGEGKVAHIMYRHQGQPVSLFMLPNAVRRRELMRVLGHEAAIWCVGNRTFVLVSREPTAEVERMASFVQASLR
jgi:anti-sigma factor RsiW